MCRVVKIDRITLGASMAGRILVCDDERFVRWALAEHLRDAGYSVFEASNGLEAMNIIEKSHPDAILLDLIMPKMDGFSVIRKLKEQASNTPILVISGVGQSSANAMALDLGVLGFVRKPFRLNEIDNLLHHAFG